MTHYEKEGFPILPVALDDDGEFIIEIDAPDYEEQMAKKFNCSPELITLLTEICNQFNFNIELIDKDIKTLLKRK